MTRLRASIVSPRINRLTDQMTSHISDPSANRSIRPPVLWKRQDFLTDGRYSTRQLGSGLLQSLSRSACGASRAALRAPHAAPSRSGAVWCGSSRSTSPPFLYSESPFVVVRIRPRRPNLRPEDAKIGTRPFKSWAATEKTYTPVVLVETRTEG